MGGDYYDRDVGTTNNSNANQVLSQKAIHSSCDPIRWKEEKLECIAKNPIVFALDVTGSMGDWTKIIYDKMPMFYGQLMMQKYLGDPSISFCAVGDHSGDQAPLQVTEFGRGNEIDQLISKIYLEGNGQGNGIEGYEMSAYFYDKRVELVSSELPFLFITGDEGFYETINDEIILRLLGTALEEKSIKGDKIFKSAMEKYNLFHVKKAHSGNGSEREQWVKAIGKERVLDIKTPKACIDIILGAIALTSGRRTLDEYIKDLVDRGQSKERVEEVTNALKNYWNALSSNKIIPIRTENKQIALDEIIKKASIEIESKFGAIAMERNQIQKRLGSQVPAEFICPLTNKIMIQPYSTSDGEVYEKTSIQLYLNAGYLINPFSKDKIESNLTKNTLLTKMIDQFVAENSS